MEPAFSIGGSASFRVLVWIRHYEVMFYVLSGSCSRVYFRSLGCSVVSSGSCSRVRLRSLGCSMSCWSTRSYRLRRWSGVGLIRLVGHYSEIAPTIFSVCRPIA